MIEVSGDAIYFEGRPVAAILVRPGTLRDRFEWALEYGADEPGTVNDRDPMTEKALS